VVPQSTPPIVLHKALSNTDSLPIYSPGTLKFVQEQPIGHYHFEWTTSLACPTKGGGGGGDDGGLSWGWIIIIVYVVFSARPLLALASPLPLIN